MANCNVCGSKLIKVWEMETCPNRECGKDRKFMESLMNGTNESAINVTSMFIRKGKKNG